MPKGESRYHEFPGYRVDLVPNGERVRVRFHGEVVADSRRTLSVQETKHEPVVYFPKDDVRSEFMERTDHETFCPFKGEASYWTLRVGDYASENTIWGYEDPFEEVAKLAGYVAFYSDRVDFEREA